MGEKLQHWVVMYFQVCSNSAYPQHSGERYRTNGPLVSITRLHIQLMHIPNCCPSVYPGTKTLFNSVTYASCAETLTVFRKLVSLLRVLRYFHNFQNQLRVVSHWWARYPKYLESVLHMSLQHWVWMRPDGICLSTDTRWRAWSYFKRRGGGSVRGPEDGKVSPWLVWITYQQNYFKQKGTLRW